MESIFELIPISETGIGSILIVISILGLYFNRRLTSRFVHILDRWRIEESDRNPQLFRWQHWAKIRPVYHRIFISTRLCLFCAFVLFISGVLLVSPPKERRDALFFWLAAMVAIGALLTYILAGMRRREVERLDRICRLRNLGFTPAAPRPSSDD